MFEPELNPAAAKFISSLVKSLQILCNGQVEFSESIELVGHINVRVDHIHKYDYIVDEQVSKEGSDSSTTFLSNSYHSCPPSKSLPPLSSQVDQLQSNHKPTVRQDVPPATRGSHTVKVSHKVPSDSSRTQDNIMVKMEGNDNDCMVLPASPEDYEQVEDVGPQEGGPLPGTSSAPCESFEIEYDVHHNNRVSNQVGKKRKAEDNNSLADIKTAANATSLICTGKDLKQNVIGEKSVEISSSIDVDKLTKETLAIPQSINYLKENIANIASMLNLQVVPTDAEEIASLNTSQSLDIKAVKKQFMENMDKEKIQKLKKLLKAKNGKRKRQELKTLIAESGVSEDLLRSLSRESSFLRRKYKKDDFSKDNKKCLRLRTQERQQKLLEMAENLKRSKGYNSSTIVVSKMGHRKISLHKSPVSIFSHQSQFLNLDNIDDAVEAMTGRMNKYGRHCDKNKEKKITSTPKRQHLKRKMRQLVSRITKDIHDAGYRVIFSNTVGSDVGSQTADLSVIPIKVDDLFPEIKEHPKLEISEEDYAKHLEREHFLEKQKANEDKMKDIEIQLTQILSGVEEVIAPKRKRYGPRDAKLTDAEAMKLFRKKLKENSEKYQELKHKRSLTPKKKKLGALASKMKESTSAAAMSTTNNTNEEGPTSPNLSLSQTVTPVNIHHPQVYVHPSTHQAPAPAVNVHHNGQYVGQVPGMQAGHQHQQDLPYSGEMDIVELIAATHNVQNQHFA